VERREEGRNRGERRKRREEEEEEEDKYRTKCEGQSGKGREGERGRRDASRRK